MTAKSPRSSDYPVGAPQTGRLWSWWIIKFLVIFLLLMHIFFSIVAKKIDF